MLTTAHLHAQTDAAAESGQFLEALAYAAEIVAAVPTDYRARIKAGLCFTALGHPQPAMAMLLSASDQLTESGNVLIALGVIRDGLSLFPSQAAFQEQLERIHALIYEQASRELQAVPPIVPADLPSDIRRYSADQHDLIEQVASLAESSSTAASSGVKRAVPLFSDLRKEVFLDLATKLQFRKLPAGTVVFKQGAPGHSLFIVVSGQVEVRKRNEDDQEEVLAQLGGGHLFGELSLLTQKPRTATVVTARPSELFELDRATVEAVAAEHPRVVEDLVRFARRRLLENLLQSSELFRPLSEQERIDVLDRFETVVKKPGEVLLEQGGPSQGLFMVLEGKLCVSATDHEGDEVVLAYLSEGEVVGEISLVEGTPANATVKAADRTVILHLNQEKFYELVAAHPALGQYLQELAEDRVEETEDATEAHSSRAETLVFI